MKKSQKQSIQELFQHHALVILLLIAALAIGYFSYHFNLMSDQTENLRNTLSDESIQVLKNMPNSISIIAFSTNSPYKGRYFRKSILALVKRYQQHKQNIQLTFIDPTKEPKLSRDFQIKSEGEWVVSYEGRSEHMTLPYTEESFTNLLLKLKHAKTQSIHYITGHQEPSLTQQSPEGFASFTKAVFQNGWKINNTQLNGQQDSDGVIIINAPHQTYSEKELELILDHLSKGENLIWLLDEEPAHDIEALIDALGLDISQGIAIDPSNTQYGMDATLVTSNQLSNNHSITRDFALRGLFPKARRVSVTQKTMQDWKVTHLIGVAKNGWLSGERKPSLQYNAEKDTLGPISIAVALERKVKEKNQRILIIGNHQFLNNQHIQSSGNQALGLRMFEWLINNYPQISLPPKPLRDSIVLIPQDSSNKNILLLLFNSFQFLIPLLLWTYGLILWQSRK